MTSRLRAPLAPLEIAGRLGRLRERFGPAEIDALLVTKLANVRYLTGFTGSAAVLLVGPGSALFVTDGRYAQRSHEELGAAGTGAEIEIALTASAQRDLLARAVAAGSRLGLEDQSVTWAQQREYAGAFEGVELVPAGTLVEGLRRVKDAGEVDRIRRACAIADDAFQELVARLADGVTERAFALELELAMRERGASGNSFDPIIASGPNGSKPHHVPGDRVIGRNELVVCDFGCIVDGYCSDMTRTVSVGDPGPDARRVYDVVLASQQAGRARVAASVECAEVDRASREVIADAGWADAFSHSTGHGVGLEIHEAPRVSSTAGDTLLVGDVVTVEPGVYLPGVGGVRIEDTVVVGATGAEPLTLTPKDLVL
ncbi:MAG TPA: aminopeptidase P family protein [Acidimicrobiia bacterium]|nr:aminopeptidase P family protein [Acidimicrobiia bacterium]